MTRLPALAAAATAAAVTVASLWLNWLVLHGTSHRSWTGTTIDGERWILWVAAGCGVVAGTTVASDLSLSRVTVAVAGSAQIVIGVLSIVIFEGLPALIPHALVPKTARRYSLDVGAGFGPWLFAAGGLLLLVSTHLDRLAKIPLPRPRVLAVVGGAATLEFLLLYLRSNAWLTGRADSHHVALDGRALPWVAPITLLVCLVSIGATLAYLLSGRVLILLAASAVCWFGSLAATLVLVPAAAAHAIHVPGVGGRVIGVAASPSCWLFAVLSVGLAASIAYLVAQEG